VAHSLLPSARSASSAVNSLKDKDITAESAEAAEKEPKSSHKEDLSTDDTDYTERRARIISSVAICEICG